MDVPALAPASLLVHGDEPEAEPPSVAFLASRRSLDALASMVIAALPFPPLPLMVSQGTDGEDATASSFDLLSQAIILQKCIGTCEPVEQIAERKISRLAQLQQDMIAHSSKENTMDSDEWLEAAYSIFKNNFRSYFVENYPTCSRDLRFESMDRVSESHVIMTQAASHVTGSLIMAGNDSGKVSFTQYKDAVRYYARAIGAGL